MHYLYLCAKSVFASVTTVIPRVPLSKFCSSSLVLYSHLGRFCSLCSLYHDAEDTLLLKVVDVVRNAFACVIGTYRTFTVFISSL